MTLTFRRAKWEDWARVLDWRNDKQSVRMSISQMPVPLGEHLDWFRYLLNSQTDSLYIAEDDGGAPVGMGRVETALDKRGGLVSTFSLAVDARVRERGAARQILRFLESAAPRGEHRAFVRTENYASLRLFVSHDFVLDENLGVDAFVVFVKERV